MKSLVRSLRTPSWSSPPTSFWWCLCLLVNLQRRKNSAQNGFKYGQLAGCSVIVFSEPFPASLTIDTSIAASVRSSDFRFKGKLFHHQNLQDLNIKFGMQSLLGRQAVESAQISSLVVVSVWTGLC